MGRYFTRWSFVVVAVFTIMGCKANTRVGNLCPDENLMPSLGGPTYLELEDPCLVECPSDQVAEFVSPLQLEDLASLNYLHITLQECIQLALQNNQVMRDLGGTLLRSSSSIVTVNDPAITYTDPRFGEEAALSEFDANLFASAFFDKVDRASNNVFLGNRGELQQDFQDYRWGISKQAATGSTFTLSHTTNYDFNNQISNIFGTPSSSWDTFLEAEVRQPLLQGAGITFNRISGPNSEPGLAQGVLIARTNTEISLARFRQGVRELLSNTENAYWDLYFAYRDLEALIDARNAALRVWQNSRALEEAGEKGAQDEAQAREQYFRFESQIVDALSGRLVDGTRTHNGSGAGTFRSAGGVRLAERRLRLILGLPMNEKLDGHDLLLPADSPMDAPLKFDWDIAVEEAEALRPDLLQQRWVIKREEMEIIAAKNFLMPRLDLVGLYRFRGFGKNLTGGFSPFRDDRNKLGPPFVSNAFADLVSGDHQEWQVGAEFSMPLGFRKGHAAVRSAELRLGRAREIYREQKRDVMFGLSNAFSELRRAFDAQMVSVDRYLAAEQLLKATEANVEKQGATVNVLLEAQRRVAESKRQFYSAQIDYMLAIKNIHYEKGTLLDYMNVSLTESESRPKALRDAAAKANARRGRMSYVNRDLVIAKGPAFNQVSFTDVPATDVITPPPGSENLVPQVMRNQEIEPTQTVGDGAPPQQ